MESRGEAIAVDDGDSLPPERRPGVSTAGPSPTPRYAAAGSGCVSMAE